jgi:hypothetical protein
MRIPKAKKLHTKLGIKCHAGYRRRHGVEYTKNKGIDLQTKVDVREITHSDPQEIYIKMDSVRIYDR